MPSDPIITRAFAEYREGCRRINRESEIVFWLAWLIAIIVVLAVRP